MFLVKVKASAEKQIRKVPKKVQDELVEIVKKLQENPRRLDLDIRKLKGSDFWRVVVASNYRCVYGIDDMGRQITIFVFCHRKDVYEKLGRMFGN